MGKRGMGKSMGKRQAWERVVDKQRWKGYDSRALDLQVVEEPWAIRFI
jgi:hypothetical protein